MSFASLEYIAFFLLVLGGTALIQKFLPDRAKELFLLAASSLFYAYWDWRFYFLLLFVIVCAYFTARRTENRAAYILGIVTPLAVLGVFKYLNFFLSSLGALAGRDPGTLKIILPVGISFYTFQALSYVIDVHRGKIPPEQDFIRLALYLSFFPQLVAGPIVRAADFLPQLRQERRVTAGRVKYGVQVMAFGFFKKIVLADHISVLVDDVYRAPGVFHWTTILLAAVSYSIQIYLDFSGYSDIAIGSAHCLGYDLGRNFNLPYISQSVTEFWKRWHISLSTWLKEYLYIPLGGSRRGTARRYINLFVTMLLGGLWHGASLTFVFWGALNGLALCIDKLLPGKNKTGGLFRAAGTPGTFAFITFTWIFFRADTFETAGAVLRGIFTLQNGVRQPFVWSYIGIALLVAGTLFAAYRAKKEKKPEINGCYPAVDLDHVAGLTAFLTFCGLILGIAFTGEHPFVYFQF